MLWLSSIPQHNGNKYLDKKKSSHQLNRKTWINYIIYIHLRGWLKNAKVSCWSKHHCWIHGVKLCQMTIKFSPFWYRQILNPRESLRFTQWFLPEYGKILHYSDEDFEDTTTLPMKFSEKWLESWHHSASLNNQPPMNLLYSSRFYQDSLLLVAWISAAQLGKQTTHLDSWWENMALAPLALYGNLFSFLWILQSSFHCI